MDNLRDVAGIVIETHYRKTAARTLSDDA